MATKLPEVAIKRGDAARLIEEVRRMLLDGAAAVDVARTIEEKFAIPPLTKCTGEAHSNPHIDNCGTCAPRWGAVGPRVVVR